MAQTSKAGTDSVPYHTQFEYAWRWFDLHARQRVSMFNFFLLSTGILANAYAILFREDLFWQAAGVAAIGAFAGLVSVVLDVRNSQLVHMGEAALKRVEQEYLALASIDVQAQHECAILTNEKRVPLWQKHKSLIRSLEIVAVCGFIAALIHSVVMACTC